MATRKAAADARKGKAAGTRPRDAARAYVDARPNAEAWLRREFAAKVGDAIADVAQDAWLAFEAAYKRDPSGDPARLLIEIVKRDALDLVRQREGRDKLRPKAAGSIAWTADALRAAVRVRCLEKIASVHATAGNAPPDLAQLEEATARTFCDREQYERYRQHLAVARQKHAAWQKLHEAMREALAIEDDSPAWRDWQTRVSASVLNVPALRSGEPDWDHYSSRLLNTGGDPCPFPEEPEQSHLDVVLYAADRPGLLPRPGGAGESEIPSVREITWIALIVGAYQIDEKVYDAVRCEAFTEAGDRVEDDEESRRVVPLEKAVAAVIERAEKAVAARRRALKTGPQDRGYAHPAITLHRERGPKPYRREP